ncbi:MAG: response regulator transcription factor [Acidimicrobiia bacterium]|nr:response regulator transcription factor [Acidimicrobiia bacterium]
MITSTDIQNAAAHIVVVDDEPMVREVVTRYLQRDGFIVTTAADGSEALRLIAAEMPDMVVLDLMLPQVSGLAVLQDVRSHSDVPVILLTARGDEGDRVLGLELGADDYVTKPFSPRELAARVKSVLRRSVPPPAPAPERIVCGNLVVDPIARRVTVDDIEIDLTRREFELLAFLAASPGQVFSRTQLLSHVWDSSPEWQDPSTVTVHVRRLRTKLATAGPDTPRVATVWGVGYRFES